MKKFVMAFTLASFAMSGSVVFAGGNPEVLQEKQEETKKTGGFILPVLLVVAVAAVASRGNTAAETGPIDD